MNGNLLVLGTIGALALGTSTRRAHRGGANTPPLLGPFYHGTPDCDAVLKQGLIHASEKPEPLPTISDVARARRSLYGETNLRRVHQEQSKRRGKRVPFVDVIRDDDLRGDLMNDAFEAFETAALTPMQGYCYATANVLYAEDYSITTEMQGCVREVEGDRDAMVPDEDWLGSALVTLSTIDTLNTRPGALNQERPGFERFSGYPEDNFTILPLSPSPRSPLDTPSFVAWGLRVLRVLGPAMLRRLDRVRTDLEIDRGYDLIVYKAALGRTVIRHALGSDAGRAWLRDGLAFAPEIAHRGSMRVVRRVERKWGER